MRVGPATSPGRPPCAHRPAAAAARISRYHAANEADAAIWPWLRFGRVLRTAAEHQRMARSTGRLSYGLPDHGRKVQRDPANKTGLVWKSSNASAAGCRPRMTRTAPACFLSSAAPSASPAAIPVGTAPDTRRSSRLGRGMPRTERRRHPMSSKPPTARQLSYLRTRAERAGQTFIPPRTRAPASAEIHRLKSNGRERFHVRRVHHRERCPRGNPAMSRSCSPGRSAGVEAARPGASGHDNRDRHRNPTRPQRGQLAGRVRSIRASLR